MKRLLAILFAIVPVLCPADNINDIESRKIDYLIAAIENLENAQFIRNGKALHGKVAANNFRLKLKKPRCSVDTAEDFIRFCAAASWASGVPYEIHFADGSEMPAVEYLRRRLAEFEAGNHMDIADET